jgi:hypothetical protein
MINKATKVEDMRRKMDRHRARFEEARRVHQIVTAPNWPEIKWWIEMQMAKSGDSVTNLTEPLQIASLMGGWNALRLLLQSAEKCIDLSEMEANMRQLHDEYQKKAMGGR